MGKGWLIFGRGKVQQGVNKLQNFVVNCRFPNSKMRNFPIMRSQNIYKGRLLTIFLILKNSSHDKNENVLFIDP